MDTAGWHRGSTRGLYFTRIIVVKKLERNGPLEGQNHRSM